MCWRSGSKDSRCRWRRAGCGFPIANLILNCRFRPYHKHLRRQWLKPNEIVEVQVEIWPTSMVFKQGHRIRLDIQPRDGIGSAPYTHYHADYNVGENTIYSGGDKESLLLVPIIPPK
jgi:predicted acyl esterase